MYIYAMSDWEKVVDKVWTHFFDFVDKMCQKMQILKYLFNHISLNFTGFYKTWQAFLKHSSVQCKNVNNEHVFGLVNFFEWKIFKNFLS